VNADSVQVALTVAERLLKPEEVIAAVPAPAGGSLAHGLAGTALLYARLSTADRVFAEAAAAHWAQAAIHAKRAGEDGAGTYHSPGGLAASLIIGPPYLPDPQTHHQATARAARWMSSRAVALAEQHREHIASGVVGTPWHVYDTIPGLAGVGRVLLAAVAAGHDAEPGLLAALEVLTAMVHTRHGGRPGWWLPADQHPSGVQVDASGAATTGLAHGIAVIWGVDPVLAGQGGDRGLRHVRRPTPAWLALRCDVRSGERVSGCHCCVSTGQRALATVRRRRPAREAPLKCPVQTSRRVLPIERRRPRRAVPRGGRRLRGAPGRGRCGGETRSWCR
jgi:hypothetical protein